MNQDLERINGVQLQSYIGDQLPIYNNDSYGGLIIVDNTGNQSLSGLVPNTYNLFIDHIHIAGGHGFSSYTQYIDTLDKLSYSYNNVIELLEYNEESEVNDVLNISINDPDNVNHLSTYNTYGFETSYINISLTKNNNIDNNFSYVINFNKYNVAYINPIEIELYDNTTYVYKNDSFPLNIKVSIGNNNNSSNYLIANEKIRINGKDLSELIKLPDSGDFSTYLFNFENKYNQDLNVEYLYNDNVISSYVIPNLLKWKEKIYVYPNGTNGNEDITSINDMISENMYTYISPNELTNIEFNPGDNFMYSQILLSNIYNKDNVEFYYNGIKSNNWSCETNSNNLFNIFTSPQQYCGQNIWQIKLLSD